MPLAHYRLTYLEGTDPFENRRVPSSPLRVGGSCRDLVVITLNRYFQCWIAHGGVYGFSYGI